MSALPSSPAPTAASPFKAGPTAAVLLAFALLLVLRLPGPWAHGRFQDEEATVFLAYAWHFPWADALFRPFGGYWNLAANAITLVLARAVQGGVIPLETAPFVTMTCGLAVQLLPPLLLLTGKAGWLSERAGRLIMVAALALAPATEEVFFNVMHIQFQLALCVALIVALDVPERRRTALGYATLLFVAPHCGPGAILLLPLLALRTLAERDRRRIPQLLALGLGAAVQLGIFYSHSPMRDASPSLSALLAAMAMRLIVLPFSGVHSSYALAPMAVSTPALTFALDVLMAAFATVLGWHAWQRRDGSLWLLGGALLVLGVTLGKGFAAPIPSAVFYVYAGSRYNLIPLALLGMTLVAGWQHEGSGARKFGYTLLLAIFLGVGTIYLPQAADLMAHGPDWRNEVAAWKRNPEHRLVVWPASQAADLSPVAHSCAPPDASADPAQPRYCESGWMAAFTANVTR